MPAMWWLSVLSLPLAPIDAPRIGVYDVGPAGGQGGSVAGLVSGLRRAGYRIETFSDLSPLGLCGWDIVYLSDLHDPGQVAPDWRRALADYVRAGGSVLQTWHHHVLGEVGLGVRRVYGSRTMKVVAEHPAVAGLTTFQARFKDHIVEQVGAMGQVLVVNEHGDPVVVAGRLGDGKVISTGLALAMPSGGASTAPSREEAALLRSVLDWLRPEVPPERRLAALLGEPRIAIQPAARLVAAGVSATFTVTVGAAAAGAATVTCEAGTTEPGETLGDPAGGAWLRSWRLTVPTSRESGERPVTARATVGDRELTVAAVVKSLWAPPPPDEVRGVWLHVGADRPAERVMPELQRLGINLAVLRIAGGTAAFYASQVQPDLQDPLAPEGDSLAAAVHHAHAHGVGLYAYVNNCIVEGRTSPATLTALRAAGRLQEGPDGRPIDWYCPSQEVNLAAIEAPMVEIASRYDVDGLQYDFIRYPNSTGCFCRACRERFERETGRPVAGWPRDVVSGERHGEWVEFRCRRISELVRRVSARVRTVRPRLKLSAAVFHNWPACREEVGQDWPRWCREGWLDEVFPMSYTLSPARFESWCATHREALPKGFRVVQGIGIASGAGSMSSGDELAVQVVLARQAGAAGFCGFAWQPDHTAALFGSLHDWLSWP